MTKIYKSGILNVTKQKELADVDSVKVVVEVWESKVIGHLKEDKGRITTLEDLLQDKEVRDWVSTGSGRLVELAALVEKVADEYQIVRKYTTLETRMNRLDAEEDKAMVMRQITFWMDRQNHKMEDVLNLVQKFAD
ncbi:hypothetical protein FT641_19455 [Bacillus paranthracis]|uniref:hypothetical protein n=1 Tax=Bacillus paranthracis TaxID=2026186 RepID=UPI001D0D0A2F|nr:hypothetical protein [Bacillus paranthracis]MBE7154870.1 hypothetical protein [Bacillus paranthracis]